MITKKRCLIERRKPVCHRSWIFPFAKNIAKNLSNKYIQKRLNQAKNMLQMLL